MYFLHIHLLFWHNANLYVFTEHLYIYKNMYIDLFIGALLLWAVINGWRNGFIKEVFSTLGVIAGLLIAAALYYYFADDFFAITGTETNMVINIVAFLILWIILPLMLGLFANILTVAIKGMQLGIPNSLLGVLFSLAKFALLLSCVLNVMSKLNILSADKTEDSKLLDPVMNVLPFVQEESKNLPDVKEAIREHLSDTTWIDFSKKK